MRLKAKRQIGHKNGSPARLWHDLRDVSIDCFSLALLSVLAVVTLSNMILTHALAGLKLVNHQISMALMQLASFFP